MTLSIALLYPELLGTYGDRGNALVLEHRARLRDIESSVIEFSPGDTLPTTCDIYLCGGGEDMAQKIATDLLREQNKSFESIVSSSIILAICAGFQILGKQFPLSSGELYDGLGIIDVTTKPGDSRIIGEAIIEPYDKSYGTLTGFENHSGRTTLTTNENALGKVTKGFGNGIQTADGFVDGYHDDHIIATYLHGPLLARNPQLADIIISKATGIDFESLKMIENDPAEQLHLERLSVN